MHDTCSLTEEAALSSTVGAPCNSQSLSVAQSSVHCIFSFPLAQREVPISALSTVSVCIPIFSSHVKYHPLALCNYGLLPLSPHVSLSSLKVLLFLLLCWKALVSVISYFIQCRTTVTETVTLLNELQEP